MFSGQSRFSSLSVLRKIKAKIHLRHKSKGGLFLAVFLYWLLPPALAGREA